MQIKNKMIFTLGSILVSVLILVSAVMLSKKSPMTQRSISQGELANADGRGTHDCYVAVDGTVYKLFSSPLWVQGQHTSSEGKAYCGADMSAVIDKAPHGRSKLAQLEKIGKLK
jgi:predicted heme/steroid binding protein